MLSIHCIYRFFQAGCPVKQAEEEEGLSQYAILAIALVSAGVVLTIFTSILLWKYPSGPCKCKGDVEDEPPQQQSTSRRPPAEAKVMGLSMENTHDDDIHRDFFAKTFAHITHVFRA